MLNIIKNILPQIFVCLNFGFFFHAEAVEVNFTRGRQETLECKLTGAFSLPEWRGPPTLGLITNQGSPALNPGYASVKENRLEYSSNSIDLVLKKVQDADAGNYQCAYTGLGNYQITVTVVEGNLICDCPCPCVDCPCVCEEAWQGLTAFGVAWSPVVFAVIVVVTICVLLKSGCFKTASIVAILVITVVYDLVVGIAAIVSCNNGCDCDCDCNCNCITCEDCDRKEVVNGLGGTCIALAVAGVCVCVGIIIKLKQGQNTKRTEEQNDDKKQDNGL